MFFYLKLRSLATFELSATTNGVVARASASQSVDLGFNPLVESYQKTLKMVTIASLLGARHLWEL